QDGSWLRREEAERDSVLSHAEPRRMRENWACCSVENLCGSNDHYIMCDNPEDDLTAFAPIGPRPQGGTEAALDHRVDRLRLPPLAVFGLEPGELLSDPSAPPAGRWLRRRPPALRRDDRAD